jgi:hypothetical protein
MTAWTDFVKKIFAEGRKKNPAFQFKDALKEASKRKSEMGSSSAAAAPRKTMKKRGKSKKSKKSGKSRKRK